MISDGFLEYETGIAENPKAFSSDLTAGRDGTIEVTLAGDVLDCVVGDVGQYEWALSPQATTLTLTAVDDACAARQAALEGPWTHTACKQEGRDCLGIVEAGTYSTNRFNPYGDFTYGEATFTLPDGWAVIHDTQASLFSGARTTTPTRIRPPGGDGRGRTSPQRHPTPTTAVAARPTSPTRRSAPAQRTSPPGWPRCRR